MYTGNALPSGATATRVAGAPAVDSFNMYDFGVVEGPVWIGDSLYFSDINSKMANLPLSRIVKLTPGTPNVISVFVADAGSNGLAVDPQGNLVSANHGKQAIVRFSVPGAMPSTLVSMFGGKPFDSPNDLAVAKDGTIYFTDPSHQTTSPQQPGTYVYQMLPGATDATIITDYTNQPNGVSLSLDESTLYVGGGNGVKTYAIVNHVVAMTGTQFGAADIGTGNTDGMVFDCAGNLYVTGVNGSMTVVVVDAAGKAVPNSPINLSDPMLPQAATNVAFGGADHKTLYITGMGNAMNRGVFEVKLAFPGLPY